MFAALSFYELNDYGDYCRLWQVCRAAHEPQQIVRPFARHGLLRPVLFHTSKLIMRFPVDPRGNCRVLYRTKKFFGFFERICYKNNVSIWISMNKLLYLYWIYCEITRDVHFFVNPLRLVGKVEFLTARDKGRFMLHSLGMNPTCLCWGFHCLPINSRDSCPFSIYFNIKLRLLSEVFCFVFWEFDSAF